MPISLYPLRSLLVVGTVALLLNLASCSTTKKEATPKPNFILIVTDDQDSDSTKVMTSLQELLQDKGATFTNTFVTSSVCAPSRGSLLTGKYPHDSGIYFGYNQLHGKNEQKTIATLLQKNGYSNCLVGKYINGYGVRHADYIPPGWDEWYAIVDENRYYNYRLNENGRLVQYGETESDYITDVLSAKATRFLEGQKGQDQPFFLFINTVAPHTPVTPAPRHESSFSDVSFQFTFERDISDKPEWVHNYMKLNKGLIDGFFGNQEAMTHFHRKRWRTLLSVDEMVKSIHHSLSQMNSLDNTYILFVSDNGDGLLHQIPVSPKTTPYDDGIRVPFIMRGPAVPANTSIDGLVSTIDILPTIAELAGVSPFNNLPGRSIVSMLDGSNNNSQDDRAVIFAEVADFGPNWPWKSPPPAYRLMRSKEFKYIEYATGEREYYNLIADPGESDNIFASLPTSRKQELQEMLEKTAGGATH